MVATAAAAGGLRPLHPRRSSARACCVRLRAAAAGGLRPLHPRRSSARACCVRLRAAAGGATARPHHPRAGGVAPEPPNAAGRVPVADFSSACPVAAYRVHMGPLRPAMRRRADTAQFACATQCAVLGVQRGRKRPLPGPWGRSLRRCGAQPHPTGRAPDAGCRGLPAAAARSRTQHAHSAR